MKIAIIGTGNVGGTLARKWGKRGHSLYLGARDPASPEAKALTKDIGPQAELCPPAEAAAKAEVVLIATPWGATEEAIRALGDLRGKIVIDCTNPLKKDLSGLEVGQTTSGGELVATWARGARVFKAFNTVGFNIMADPVLEGRKTVMFYCGDDQSGREAVRELVNDVGFEAVDVGPLASARLLEPWAMLWIASAYKYGLGRDYGFGILRKKD